MLSMGMLSLGAGVALLWVSFHGQDYITKDDAKDWTKSWADVVKALGGWLNPDNSSATSGSNSSSGGTFGGAGGNF